MASHPGFFDPVWPTAPLGWLHTYANGTTTPKQAWKDALETQTHELPTAGVPASGINLDANGRPPTGFFLGDGRYTIHVYTAAGVLVTQRHDVESTDDLAISLDSALRADLSSTTDAAENAGQIGYSATLLYAAATVGRKLRQIVSPRDYPWSAVGDGIADDTAALTAFFAASEGMDCNFEDGKTYLVSSGFTLKSGAHYRGKSSIKAKSGANISSAILRGTGLVGTTIEGLEIDANVSGFGSSSYGVYLDGGSRNIVVHAFVHDTQEAGIRMEAEQGFHVISNTLTDCGRTGTTDNHGLMFGTNGASDCNGFVVGWNIIKSAFRKGIATYSFGSGRLHSGSIVGNVVSDCGLGGIYISGNIGSTNKADSITFAGNVAHNNYVNFEFTNAQGITGAGNVSDFTDQTDKYAGFAIAGCVDINLEGVSNNAPLHGAVIGASGVVSSARVRLALQIRNPNQLTAATGCGVQITDATYCTIDCDISDGSGKMTHGVLEGTGADNNDVSGTVRDGTSARILLVGSSSRMVSRSGKNTGFNTQTPLDTVHIAGTITRDWGEIVLANGDNNNVVLPSGKGKFYVTGPTGAFAITGFAGGWSGREFDLLNYTGQTCTIKHEAGSSAANRLVNAGNADYTIATQQFSKFSYLGPASRWVSR